MVAPSKVPNSESVKKGPAPPSEKVPEHAKTVYDDEKVVKEIADLKKRLKEVYTQNQEL